jgi:hypothetical protein
MKAVQKYDLMPELHGCFEFIKTSRSQYYLSTRVGYRRILLPCKWLRDSMSTRTWMMCGSAEMPIHTPFIICDVGVEGSRGSRWQTELSFELLSNREIMIHFG